MNWLVCLLDSICTKVFCKIKLQVRDGTWIMQIMFENDIRDELRLLQLTF